MTGEHPHTESPVHWGRTRMYEHLRDDHGLTMPMAWTTGQMHLAHLNAHTSPQPEETPMLTEHSHPEGLATFQGTVSATALAGHLEVAHGVDTVGMDHQDMRRAHVSAHLAQAKPEPEDPEDLARQLFLETFPGGDWDELQQETRDYWRKQVELRAGNEDEPEDEDSVRVNQENSQVRKDRVICAMAGVDFERYFVPDDSGSLRGVLRRTYGQQARDLLTAVDRGHLRHYLLPADEAAQGMLAQVNDRLEATQEALRTSERERNRAQADRQETLDFLARVQEGLRTKQAEVDQLREERDRAIQAGEILEAQRNTAMSERIAARQGEEAARLQRDKAKQLLHARTVALEEGRGRLRQWAHEIWEAAKGVPNPGYLDFDGAQVIDRIQEILGEKVPSATSYPIREKEHEEGLAQVHQLRAVDDHAMRQPLPEATRSLTMTIPPGTARVMLTFVPQDREDTDGER